MSLIISLTCALLATLLQQWARKYITVTQARFSPHKRAQVHAFFAEGVQALHVPWVVQVLPTLLHLSLFLFLVGVVVFLNNVNDTIFELVLPWACICAVLYVCITFMPIFRRDSPYFTPLSSSVWFIVNGIAFVVLLAFRWSAGYCNRKAVNWLRELEGRYRHSLSQGMQNIIDETAQNSPLRVDGRVFMRTFDSLEKDGDLELFFNGIYGFRSSKVAAHADPLLFLNRSEKRKLFDELLGFMDRTFSSDFLSRDIKNRRAMICTKALNPADIPGAFRWILDKILSDDEYHGLKTVEFGRVVRDWGSGDIKRTAAVAVQAIVSLILVRARKRDDSWFALANKQLEVPEPVLRGFAISDNSVSLANLIYITRRLFNLLREGNPLSLGPIVLEAVSGFDIHDTSLELQQDFCALWNEVVDRGSPLVAREILKYIRHVYFALHKGNAALNAGPTSVTESTSDLIWFLDYPSSYPQCNLPGHRGDSTHHVYRVTASTAIARPILRDNFAQVPTSPVSTYDKRSSSLPAPLRVDENTKDVPPLHSYSPVQGSFRFAHPRTVKDRHIPAPSPDPTTSNATQRRVDTPAGTIPRSTPGTSTPIPPLAPTSPLSSVISPQHNADPRTSSDAPDFRSSYPVLVPETIPPTEPPLSSDPSVTRPDNALAHESLPGSYSSTLATSSPGNPQSTSVPDPGGGAEDEGGAKAILHKDKDALDLPVHHANTMTGSSTTVADVSIEGPSRQSGYRCDTI